MDWEVENEIQEERKRQIVGSGCGKVAELSLPIPDVHSLNPVIGKILQWTANGWKDEIKKK